MVSRLRDKRWKIQLGNLAFKIRRFFAFVIETFYPSLGYDWEEKEVVTISKSSSEPGICFNITSQGRKLSMLVDTGATKSILSQNVYSQFLSNIILSVNNLPKLQLADDTPLYVTGRTEAKMKLGPLNLNQKLLVAYIADERIWYLDFLWNNKYKLDLRTDELDIDQCKILLGNRQPIIEIGRVTCKEDILVPPRTEFILPTDISYECEGNPSFELSKCLKIGSCLVDLQSSPASVSVLNPTNEPVKVRKVETAGYAYDVLEIEVLTTEKQTQSPNTLHQLCGVSTTDTGIKKKALQLTNYLVELNKYPNKLKIPLNLLTSRKYLESFKTVFQTVSMT